MDNTTNKKSNANVKIIIFVHRGLANKLCLNALTIIVAIICLIIAFDADSYGIIIVTKITFNLYNCCCNFTLYFNLSRKLIYVIRNCFLWCSNYCIRKICINHTFIVIIISTTRIQNGIECKSCNFFPLSIIDMIHTIRMPEEQPQRPQAPPSIHKRLVNNDHSTCNGKCFKTTVTVTDITVKLLFVSDTSTGAYSCVSNRNASIRWITKIMVTFLDTTSIVEEYTRVFLEENHKHQRKKNVNKSFCSNECIFNLVIFYDCVYYKWYTYTRFWYICRYDSSPLIIFLCLHVKFLVMLFICICDCCVLFALKQQENLQ